MLTAANLPLTRRAGLRAALAASVGVLAGGCIPAPYGTYFRPATTAPGARFQRAWCQGQAGPTTQVAFEAAGLAVQARVESGSHVGPLPRVVAMLTLPPGGAFSYLQAARLHGTAGPLPVELGTVAQREVVLAAGSWVDPAALRPGGRAHDPAAAFGTARFEFELVPGVGPAIVVEGLAVERDAGRVLLPPVAMRRPASRSSPRLYRSDAQQAALEARAAACRRDTPQRACDNIVAFGEPSHEAEAPGLRWQQRWYSIGGGAGQDLLEGALVVLPRQPGRWRLDAVHAVVREAAGGGPRALKLRRSAIAFQDVPAPGLAFAASGAETRLHMEASLPEGTGDFTLVWPRLQGEGAAVALPDVQFQRRSFDGGVEPFNC